jgi:galactokinase
MSVSWHQKCRYSELREKVSWSSSSSNSTTITSTSGKSNAADAGGADNSSLCDSKPSARKKQCKSAVNNVSASSGAEKMADAIREFANAKMQAELAKQKVRHVENEDSRRERELLLFEWEKVQNSICMLRRPA